MEDFDMSKPNHYKIVVPLIFTPGKPTFNDRIVPEDVWNSTITKTDRLPLMHKTKTLYGEIIEEVQIGYVDTRRSYDYLCKHSDAPSYVCTLVDSLLSRVIQPEHIEPLINSLGTCYGKQDSSSYPFYTEFQYIAHPNIVISPMYLVNTDEFTKDGKYSIVNKIYGIKDMQLVSLNDSLIKYNDSHR